jgi:hypothetical protein
MEHLVNMLVVVATGYRVGADWSVRYLKYTDTGCTSVMEHVSVRERARACASGVEHYVTCCRSDRSGKLSHA